MKLKFICTILFLILSGHLLFAMDEDSKRKSDAILADMSALYDQATLLERSMQEGDTGWCCEFDVLRNAACFAGMALSSSMELKGVPLNFPCDRFLFSRLLVSEAFILQGLKRIVKRADDEPVRVNKGEPAWCVSLRSMCGDSDFSCIERWWHHCCNSCHEKED